MHTRGAESLSRTPPSIGAANFAGILASVTDPPWNDDGLADDVATISYEHALRTQARSRTSQNIADRNPPRQEQPVPAPKPVKTASITIRLSESECAQVRRRAAEAGLTISAYLRSCALEVESLRTQVKEALAHLRGSTSLTIEPGLTAGQTHRHGIASRLWRWIIRKEPPR